MTRSSRWRPGRYDIAGAVVAVLLPVIAAIGYRDRVLDTLGALFCGPTGCADALLAGLGWAVSGAPVVGLALLYIYRPGNRVTFWLMIFAVAVLAGGLGTTVTGRSSAGPRATQTHPEMAPYVVATYVAVGALVVAVLAARAIVPGADRSRSVATRRLWIVAGLQLPALLIALAIS